MIVKIEHAINENLRYGHILNERWYVLSVIDRGERFTTVRLNQPGFSKLLSVRNATVDEILQLRLSQLDPQPPKGSSGLH